MSDESQCDWKPDPNEAYSLFLQHGVQRGSIFLQHCVQCNSLFLQYCVQCNPAEDSSGGTSAIDPALKTPGRQNINQVTVRELYESSKRAKERNDKAAAEKR